MTTEAVGRYTPEAQAECLFACRPEMASVALREICPEDGNAFASLVYHRAVDEGIHLQHILYDPSDLRRFEELRDVGVVPPEPSSFIFVLG